MHRHIEIAIGACDLAHNQLVEERLILIGNRQDRDCNATGFDIGHRFDRNARDLAVPASKLLSGMSGRKRQHLRCVAIEVVSTRPAEEDFRIEMRLFGCSSDLLCAFDQLFPSRMVFGSH